LPARSEAGQLTTRNHGLQAARAIAALMVAYFHSYVAIRGNFPENVWSPLPWLSQWGFLGVDLFFAISGFVICMVVSKPSFTLREFAIKRVLRLYPMYWCTMALVLLLIWWGRYGAVPVGHFLYSMTLLPQQGPAAYDISWTLEREMVFYALAAITVRIAGLWLLAAVLLALGTAGLLLHNPWSFHLVSTYQLDFLGGVAAFALRARISSLMAGIAFAAGLAAWAMMTQAQSPYLVPLSVTLLVVGFAGMNLPWDRRPFSWLVRTGDASYSIYLLHYAVFLVLNYASVVWLKLPQWACEPWRYFSIALSVAISFATWRLIEKPMINLGDRLSRSRVKHHHLRTGRDACAAGDRRPAGLTI
jgi:peptidoglycan/LPS O-acetylase OafA/YrhL